MPFWSTNWSRLNFKRSKRRHRFTVEFQINAAQGGAFYGTLRCYQARLFNKRR